MHRASALVALSVCLSALAACLLADTLAPITYTPGSPYLWRYQCDVTGTASAPVTAFFRTDMVPSVSTSAPLVGAAGSGSVTFDLLALGSQSITATVSGTAVTVTTQQLAALNATLAAQQYAAQQAAQAAAAAAAAAAASTSTTSTASGP